MWLTLLSAAHATDPGCGMPHLADLITDRGLERAARPAPRAPLADGEPKELRNVYSALAMQETENFVLRWGKFTSFTQEDLDRIAAALELSWQVEIEELGWAVPEYSDTYKLNVYITGTNEGVPDLYQGSAMTWYDDDGYPMILVPDTYIDNGGGDLTMAHELHHASQFAYDTIQFVGTGPWFYEAGASWIEARVYPEEPDYMTLAYAPVVRPELSIDHYTPNLLGGVESDYKYGQLLFIKHLVDHYDAEVWLQELWADAEYDADPLTRVADVLEANGHTLTNVSIDYSRRNTTLDYNQRAWLLDTVERFEGYGWLDTHRIHKVINDDTEGWLEPDGDLPERFGSQNYLLQLRAPYTITFEGDPGPDTWYAAFVWRNGIEHSYVDIPVDGSSFEFDDPSLDDADETWLVIATGDGPADETFTYRFELDGTAGVATGDNSFGTVEPGREGGCGCRSAAAGSTLVWGALLGMLARRRR